MPSSSAATQPATAAELSPSAGSYLSWGRYPAATHRAVYRANWMDQVPGILDRAAPESLLAYGLGRSYGDSCLNDGRDLVECSRLDRILGFDADQGHILCEAGVSLSDILAVAVPRGWFLPVTPGTRFVTLGGAIANDVHGKNHHRAGTLGRHVRRLELCRSDHGLLLCSPESNPDLFRATIGGLGLTGVITCAEIALKKISGPFIDLETIPFHSLPEFLSLSHDSDQTFEYTVAWVDCVSQKGTRGIFFRGNHSDRPGKAPRSGGHARVPFAFPGWVLNRYTMKLFNSAYYTRHAFGKRQSVAPYEPFFYPLDAVSQWNLIYGKQGFLQYQCVIPDDSFEAFQEVLGLISRSHMGSFLAVMKRFGSVPSAGMMSFPRPGLTLALDFAMRGDSTLRLLDELDKVVIRSAGAVYPAKDARMSPAAFDASFPNWREFQEFIDPKLSSSFWRRVTGAQ
ncbi:MAG TPA: FAD-binding oxidoreductase [Terriglobales bacterium]|nr:FAD-binding oxidoreductase [Terriglobales bacterium]